MTMRGRKSGLGTKKKGKDCPPGEPLTSIKPPKDKEVALVGLGLSPKVFVSK